MELFETILSSEGDIFAVHTGISEILLEQLVAASTADDEALQKFTDDPVRFSHQEKAKKWLQGKRRVYTLTPKDHPDRLAGFGWFRDDKMLHIPDIVENTTLLEEYQSTQGKWVSTVAARMYGEYRGQRLATPFMESAHREYSAHIGGNINSIIALIHAENLPSQKLFARLWYQLAWTQKNRTFWILNHTNLQKYKNGL